MANVTLASLLEQLRNGLNETREGLNQEMSKTSMLMSTFNKVLDGIDSLREFVQINDSLTQVVILSIIEYDRDLKKHIINKLNLLIDEIEKRPKNSFNDQSLELTHGFLSILHSSGEKINIH